MTVKTLTEKRATVVADARSIIQAAETENRQPTTEERSQFDTLMAEADALKADIDRLSRLENEERALNGSKGRVIETAVRNETDDALRSWLGNPDAGKFYVTKLEERALAVGTDAAGGHTVADGFVASLEQALKAHDGMRGVARVIRTSTGAPLPWPTADDTDEEGVLIAENTAAEENDVTFSAVTLGSYKISSGIVRVSNELIQDSGINIGQVLGDMLGSRIGRALNRYHTVGTGTAQFQGAMTGATASGVVQDTLGEITYGELVQLQHSVDPAYRAGAVFMFNDKTLAALKQLVDLNGRPLWLSGMASNEPGTILGHRYVINQHMADLDTAGGKAIAFGLGSKFIIRDVRDIQIVRLNERYAEYDQQAFAGWYRGDSKMLQPQAFKFITNAAA